MEFPKHTSFTPSAMYTLQMPSSVIYCKSTSPMPIIDLKPYIPISDRIRDYKVAEWLADWPEWMEDAAEYFAEQATDFG